MPPLAPRDCVSLFRSCATLRQLKSLHAAMLRVDLLPHPRFLTTDLVNNYSRLGDMSYAHAVFSAVPFPPDSFLWNAIIRGYTENGPPGRAIELYRQMRDKGVSHDYYTYPIVIKACSALRDIEVGRRIHQETEELGHATNVGVINALIGMYGKCGDLDAACKLFDEMPDKTVVSWSAMISAYVNNGSPENALATFSRMLAEGIEPNRGTFASLLSCISKSDDADKLYHLVQKSAFSGDEMIKNAVAQMFARCGGTETVQCISDGKEATNQGGTETVQCLSDGKEATNQGGTAAPTQ